MKPNYEVQFDRPRFRSPNVPVIPKTIIQAMRIRQRRTRVLPVRLFSDPGWDMLLFLYEQKQKAKDVSIKALCLGADVAHTTGLRYLAALESHGVVERSSDPYDGRRTFVRISDFGLQALEYIFSDNKN